VIGHITASRKMTPYCLARGETYYLRRQVKQSHYRPGQALRSPGGWGSQISTQSAHEGGNVVSPMYRPPLPQGNIPLVIIYFRGWVDPKTTARPEGLFEWKIPVTPSGIGPATFRFVAQCLNQLRHTCVGTLIVPSPYTLQPRDEVKIFIPEVYIHLHNTTQHNTTQHNTAQHSTTQHSTAQHSTAQHNTTQHNTTQHSTTQHSTAQHNTTQHNTTQHSTTQHNTAQHNTAQHSTTQHCNLFIDARVI
jgi:hypothetical protein